MPGGTEVYLRNLIKELRQKDNQSQLFIATFNKKNNLYSKYGARVEDSIMTRFLENYRVLRFQNSIPLVGFVTFLWGIYWLYRTSLKIIKKNHIDLIYANGGNLSAIVAYLLYRKTGIKYLIHFHGLFDFTKLLNKNTLSIKSIIFRTITRAFLTNAHTLIANSNDVANDIHNIKDMHLHPVIVNCFVDTDVFYPQDQSACRKKLRLPKKNFIIVSTNRLEEDKRIHFLIKIAQLLQNKNIKIIFIGDGPLRKDVEDLSMNNRNVVYYPPMNNIYLPQYLNAADIVWGACSLSYLSLTLIEALACGKPIMASNIPVSHDITHGKTVYPKTIPLTIGFLIKENVKTVLLFLNQLDKNRGILNQKKGNCLRFYHQMYGRTNIERVMAIIYNA